MTTVKEVIKTDSSNIYDCSFHDVVVKTTKEKLVKIFGEPTYEEGDVDEKVQNSWDLQMTLDEDGEERICFLTLYDWKQYYYYSDNEVIEWHIGGVNRREETELAVWMYNRLKTL